MRRSHLVCILALALALAGCSMPPGAAPTPVSLFPTPTPTEAALPPGATPSPTEPPVQPTATPLPTETPAPPESPDPRGEEAIFIERPGNGSRVSSPVTVSGVADPTFEQNLVVRILLDDGSVLALIPTTIAADLGLRGPYEVQVDFVVTEERQGFIQVFDVSARDGGILHLSSVGVTLLPGGPDEIVIAEPQPERIAILQPTLGATIRGGVARVEGFALASFEQTLVIQALDEEGNVVGQEPIMVMAPDLGQPGPFSADVAYTVAAAGPGRIVVRDISPAHGEDTHLASVEISLEP